MGISVSAGTAVILVGVFLMLGAIVPGMLNAHDRVATATDERDQLIMDRAETAVAIDAINQTNGTTTVDVENTGNTVLSLRETSILVDNTYVPIGEASVQQTNETDIWLPDETASFNVSVNGSNSLVVVTEYGVRDRIPVGED